jgi:hypothetical protein
MTKPMLRVVASAGLSAALLTGCGASRPEPMTVQPDFSYLDGQSDTRQAQHWPAPSDDFAEAPTNRAADDGQFP